MTKPTTFPRRKTRADNPFIKAGAVRSLALITTAHVSHETARIMDLWCRRIDIHNRQNFSDGVPLTIGATDYGWIVNCGMEERPERVPDDLWACIALAKAHRIPYLLFDSEIGDTIEGLETYEW